MLLYMKNFTCEFACACDHDSLFYTYNILCRKVLSEYGLWDQIRVDHGREWVLMLSVQQKLAQFRSNSTKAPYLQTSSKKVCVISLLGDHHPTADCRSPATHYTKTIIGLGQKIII